MATTNDKVGDLTFHYFTARYLGEPVRWILSYAKLPFTDKRTIGATEWNDVKPTIPWGKLPVLLINGKHEMAQSVAMSQFFGEKCGLVPSDSFQRAKCLEIVLHIQDVRGLWEPFVMDMENREKHCEHALKDIFPYYLPKFQDLLNHGKNYLLGDQLTYSDLWLASWLELWSDKGIMGETILEPYPKLQAHLKRIKELDGIKQWIQKRPASSDFMGLKL